LHQLYYAYVVHPDAPISPLDFSSSGRTVTPLDSSTSRARRRDIVL
jgi:hypothetical protein